MALKKGMQLDLKKTLLLKLKFFMDKAFSKRKSELITETASSPASLEKWFNL